MKWLAIAAAALAVALLVLLWAVLGVNPLEGRVDRLWSLVSKDVDFFVRFPGTQLLGEPFVKGLQSSEGFPALGDLEDELRRATLEVARQANPKIPFGLVEVDLEKDFFGAEMAIAGTVADYAQPRLGSFLALTRVPYYVRLVSALKRGFVRSRVPDASRIEVVKGLYFRVRLDAEGVQALRPFRATTSRPDEDSLYFARVGDVLLLSDNQDWIETALGSGQTLPSISYFESEFIATAQGGRCVEAFVSGSLVANLLIRHGRSGGLLAFVSELVPVRIVGDVVLRAVPQEEPSLRGGISMRPMIEGFSQLKPYLGKLYNEEKSDPRFDLGAAGVGRFVPRDRTVAAFLLRGSPDTLVDLVTSLMSRDDLKLLDDMARERSNSNFPTFERLLKHLTEDLADTHLIVLQRPSVFDGYDYSSYRESSGEPAPDGQVSATLVLQVKDSVAPDKVRERLAKNLALLDLEPAGIHEETKFHLAKLRTQAAKTRLIEPIFGVFPEGMRFVLFSTSVESAEAVYGAALNPSERLLADEAVQKLVGSLAPRATLAAIVRAEPLRRHLADQVRV
ncbi:MAG: hypothetical protein ACREID_00570, partial [Planctomycetota bacterium]